MSSETRQDRIAVLALIAADLLFFWRIVFLGKVLFWGDTLLQAYPWRRFVQEHVLAGDIPLWNPFIFCGLPFAANPQPALFYPINMLFLALPVERALSLSVVLHVAIALIGMYVYLRTALGVSPAQATIGALAFGLGGFTTVKLQFAPVINVIVWLPWVLWVMERLRRRPTIGWTAALAGLLATQWLGGHLQFAVLLTFFEVGYGVTLSLPPADTQSQMAGRKSQTHRRALLCLGCALPVAAFLTAIQWLPFVELAKHSTRTGLTYEKATMFSLPWWQWIGFAFPNTFGNPGLGNYIGAGNYFEACVYMGLVPFLLALLGLWKGRDRRLTMMLGFAVAGLILSLGSFGPLHRFLFDHVAVFRMVRAPARFVCWTIFPLAVFSAIGARTLEEEWLATDEGVSKVRRGAFVLVVYAALTCAALFVWLPRVVAALRPGLGTSLASSIASTWAEDLKLAVFVLLLALIAVYFPAPGRHTVSPAMILGWAAVLDLFAFGSRFYPLTDAREFHQPVDLSYLKGVDLSRHRFLTPLESVDRLWIRYFPYGSFGRWSPERVQEARRWLIPNANMPLHLYNGEGYDAVRLSAYEKPLREIEDALAHGEVSPLLDVAGVEALVLAPRRWGPKEECQPQVLRNRSALPRTYLFGWNLGERGTFTPGYVTEFEDRVNRVAETIQANRQCQLVLNDVWFPGWRAAVDGRPARLRPLDFAGLVFRQITVPQGEHTVVQTYYPRTFLFGEFLSLVGLAVVAACVAVPTGKRADAGAR